jgi:xanthine dehydrogenase large subunit
MRMTGKRHFSSDFKIGFDADLKIVAYSHLLPEHGCRHRPLLQPLTDAPFFHATNAYFVA